MKLRVFVCSDTHLGHNKDFLYAPRGFTNIQEHNEAVVRNWNSEITDDDIVYHLGDVVLGDIDTGIEYLKQLKGQIKIIPGNHDTPSKIARYQELENVEVLPLAYLLKYKKYMFYLSHYPTLCSNYDVDKPLKARVINLCGHRHTNDAWEDWDKGLIYHVELDAHNCYPILLDEIIEVLKEAVAAPVKPTGDTGCRNCAHQGQCSGWVENIRCKYYEKDPIDGGFY